MINKLHLRYTLAPMRVEQRKITLIASYTDFGSTGPYQGQMAAVLASQAPQTPQISLMSDAPVFDAQSAGLLLANLCDDLPGDTLVLAVVDPGVGGNRRPLMLKTESFLFVGPDNGLFIPLVRRSQSCMVEAITWRPARLSNSFHGRDLFAPVAAQLANGQEVEGRPVKPDDLVGFNRSQDANRLIYLDHYGNAITGIEGKNVSDNQVFTLRSEDLRYARTFEEVPVGQAFWYRNSMGLVEFAVNRGSAAKQLKLELGMSIEL
jgi:S-adenosylmethionine hydrolase